MSFGNCPACKHPISEHYSSCAVFEDNGIGTGDYCGCEEKFNLATGGRYPNRDEMIAMLERAADKLQELAAAGDNDPLAIEIRKALKGEL